MRGIVNGLKGKAAIWSDLGRLEKRAERRRTKLGKYKCRVVTWEGRPDGLGSSSAEKALGVLADRQHS